MTPYVVRICYRGVVSSGIFSDVKKKLLLYTSWFEHFQHTQKSRFAGKEEDLTVSQRQRKIFIAFRELWSRCGGFIAFPKI